MPSIYISLTMACSPAVHRKLIVSTVSGVTQMSHNATLYYIAYLVGRTIVG